METGDLAQRKGRIERQGNQNPLVHVYRYKLTQKRPLIVEIPDRHGEGDVSQTIEKYVSEAIGVKL